VEKKEEEETGGGGAFAALNMVGILAAGGLLGYLSIQKKESQETEAEYQKRLQSGAPCCPAEPCKQSTTLQSAAAQHCSTLLCS
jgi:uncharacterized membrane protein YebE (DUF533 family)